MTYFGVLFTFILPPLLLLALLVPRDLWSVLLHKQRPSPGLLMPYVAVLTHVVIAVVYTTPWDNYLVATGVWWYDPELVHGLTLGYVPIEEYTFFVVQTLLTGLWAVAVARRFSEHPAGQAPGKLRLVVSLVVFFVWFVSTLLFFSGGKAFTYLTLILSWALLPVMLQTAFGADLLWKRRRELVISVMTPTLYLWLVDAIAIRSGTWTIDPAQTTGLTIAGLPIEEMLFFFMTNLIIVFGITLMLSNESKPRMQEWLSRLRGWVSRSERKEGQGSRTAAEL